MVISSFPNKILAVMPSTIPHFSSADLYAGDIALESETDAP